MYRFLYTSFWFLLNEMKQPLWNVSHARKENIALNFSTESNKRRYHFVYSLGNRVQLDLIKIIK